MCAPCGPTCGRVSVACQSRVGRHEPTSMSAVTRPILPPLGQHKAHFLLPSSIFPALLREAFSGRRPFLTFKGTQSALGPRWTGHLFSHFEKSLPQPEIKVHLEIRFNLCSVLLDFKSFTEKSVFSVFLLNPMILFLSHLVKISTDCTQCKLAIEWYPMRMCTSWLCPFKSGNVYRSKPNLNVKVKEKDTFLLFFSFKALALS